MRRSNVVLTLSLLLVFASGILVGVAGDRYLAGSRKAASSLPRTPEDYRRIYVEEMNRRLKLTAEQMEQLNRILDETREQFRQLRERQRSEVKVLQEAQTAKINAILTPGQQEEYARMRKEREEKRRRAERERSR